MTVRPFEKDLRAARRGLAAGALVAVAAWLVLLVVAGTDGESPRSLAGTLLVFLGIGVAFGGGIFGFGFHYDTPAQDRAQSPWRSYGLLAGLVVGGLALAVLGVVLAGGARWQQ